MPEHEHLDKMQESTMEKYDELIDTLSGYVEISKAGTIRYYNKNGKLHRIGGPAVIFADGTEIWYQNGLFHRTDGPSVIYPNGECDWYLNGSYHRTDGNATDA